MELMVTTVVVLETSAGIIGACVERPGMCVEEADTCMVFLEACMGLGWVLISSVSLTEHASLVKVLFTPLYLISRLSDPSDAMEVLYTADPFLLVSVE